MGVARESARKFCQLFHTEETRRCGDCIRGRVRQRIRPASKISPDFVEIIEGDASEILHRRKEVHTRFKRRCRNVTGRTLPLSCVTAKKAVVSLTMFEAPVELKDFGGSTHP